MPSQPQPWLVAACTAGSSQLGIPIAIYAFSAVVLFGISATYHRVNWRPGAVIMQQVIIRRSSSLIMRSYTAVAAAIVTGRSGTVMVIAAWVAATVGVLARLLWVKAPRWVFTPTYILFGWRSSSLRRSSQNGGALVFALIMGGGIFMHRRAIIFALADQPDPSRTGLASTRSSIHSPSAAA